MAHAVVAGMEALESSTGVGVDGDSVTLLGFLVRGVSISPALPKLPLPLLSVIGAGLASHGACVAGAANAGGAGMPGLTPTGAAVGGAVVG